MHSFMFVIVRLGQSMWNLLLPVEQLLVDSLLSILCKINHIGVPKASSTHLIAFQFSSSFNFAYNHQIYYSAVVTLGSINKHPHSLWIYYVCVFVRIIFVRIVRGLEVSGAFSHHLNFNVSCPLLTSTMTRTCQHRDAKFLAGFLGFRYASWWNGTEHLNYKSVVALRWTK